MARLSDSDTEEEEETSSAKSTPIESQINELRAAVGEAAKNLISSAIQTLYKRMGIKITVGTAYHHQLVALVERWHRTLSQLIRVHLAASSNRGCWMGQQVVPVHSAHGASLQQHNQPIDEVHTILSRTYDMLGCHLAK